MKVADCEQQLFDPESVTDTGPVVCLGMTFESDENRREYFLEELRAKLKDQAFREIEGFPIGTDEDILALSDPPYYTACPNPWIVDFIKEWETQKPQQPGDDNYHREPFAADVSEGKNDPIYNAHSYHTKVPHKAIMRYILHYTEPGDIVFDGFCGTGMTGVAAQLCGDRNTVLSLGYQVTEDGAILRETTDENGRKTWEPFSRLGVRRAVLNDLSPAATFIAYNYNTPVDVAAFELEAKRIIKEVEEECGWMYETLHTDGRTKGRVNYTVWSDVFVCPTCTGEVVFFGAAVDKQAGKVSSEFPCPHCNATLSKRNMERAWETRYDTAINESVRQAKQKPVLINYSLQGGRGRYEKTPDEQDLGLIRRIEKSEIPYWFPTDPLPDGYNTRQPIRSHGITHVHLFYTKRNLWTLAALWKKCHSLSLKLIFTGILQISSMQSSFRYDSRNPQNTAGGILKGTLYVPSLPREGSIFENYKRRMASIISGLKNLQLNRFPQSLESASLESTSVNDSALDYIFLDPPFGANLNYSELNLIWETWLRVITNNKPEAIENTVQGKGPNEYRHLMTACFMEAYRALKPGRWMTVEFSNTKAAVWNAIQTALTDAGFVIANVSALDKQQGSFKAVTTPTAVKQDLVISTYKPNDGLEERFNLKAGTEDGVWEFIRTHLKQLPIVIPSNGRLELVAERQNYLLFDRMLAFHVQRGVMVPVSAAEFYSGLEQRFPMRDGMYFLPDQVAEYDKKRLKSEGIAQAQLFVSDEASAIQWLKQVLGSKPQTFQELHPQFLKEIAGWQKHEKAIELSEMLAQNFLCYDGVGEVPGQIHSYLSTNFKECRNLPKDSFTLKTRAKGRWYIPDPNKATDLEQLRERGLLREFEEYRASAQRRLKVFRLEAVRAGFKKAWQEQDYASITEVAEKISENVLQEDPKLLMWYDMALTRTEEE